MNIYIHLKCVNMLHYAIIQTCIYMNKDPQQGAAAMSRQLSGTIGGGGGTTRSTRSAARAAAEIASSLRRRAVVINKESRYQQEERSLPPRRAVNTRRLQQEDIDSTLRTFVTDSAERCAKSR